MLAVAVCISLRLSVCRLYVDDEISPTCVLRECDVVHVHDICILCRMLLNVDLKTKLVKHFSENWVDLRITRSQ